MLGIGFLPHAGFDVETDVGLDVEEVLVFLHINTASEIFLCLDVLTKCSFRAK